MIEMAGAAAVTAEVEDARRGLLVVEARLAEAVAGAPRHRAADWHGLASDAYQLALSELARELDAAQELLRSASDLLGTAIFELGGHV